MPALGDEPIVIEFRGWVRVVRSRPTTDDWKTTEVYTHLVDMRMKGSCDERGEITVRLQPEILSTGCINTPYDGDDLDVDQWLATLIGDLVPGGRAQLDFGDGDFFDLDVEEVAKPVLRWAWRSIGCGPRDTVEVRINRRDGGSVVTVSDRAPHRSREESVGLGEGWRDFTSRLQRHVATGARSRYDWRSDVDVSIELPLDADAARRLVIGSAAAWLPLEEGPGI